MKPIFMDSFDHYSDPTLKYYDAHNATIIRNAGRFGTDGCSLASDGYLEYYQPFMDFTFVESAQNYSNIFIGLAYQRTIGADGTLLDFCINQDASSSDIAVGVKSDGTIYASSGSDYAETSRRLSLGQWYYLEVNLRWPNGGPEVRVNGTVWDMPLPPFHSWGGSFTGYINAIFIRGAGIPYLDDIYILAGDRNGFSDAPNPPNDDYWGDTRIETSFPTSDGAYQDWTPSSGSFGYLMVNNPYAQFTDNVYTYPQYQRETFGMTYNIALPGTVNAVQHSYLSRQVSWSESILYTGGSVYYPFSVSDDFRFSFPANEAAEYLSTIWEKDPSSGSSWDSVNLPVAEFGFMSNTSSGSL